MSLYLGGARQSVEEVVMANPYKEIFRVPGTKGFAAAAFAARMPLAMAPIGIVAMLSQTHGGYWLAGAVSATFAFTNAAPQAALFNQGPTLWVGLEDHVLNYARAVEQKISVFTGPVLDSDDPPYRGIQIPRRFWKIAAWTARTDRERPELRAAGFVLDQSPALEALDLDGPRAVAEESPPPLGPFLTFQVPISEIAAIAGLDVSDLEAADRFTAAPGARPSDAWQLITDHSDIRM